MVLVTMSRLLGAADYRVLTMDDDDIKTVTMRSQDVRYCGVPLRDVRRARARDFHQRLCGGRARLPASVTF